MLGSRSYMLPSFNKSVLPNQLDFSSLNDVYSVMRSKYDGNIDTAKLIDGAKHGMVDALGDPHTAVVLGRPGGPLFRPSEVARLGYLAGIVATILR